MPRATTSILNVCFSDVTMRPSGPTSESMLRLMYAEYFGSRVDAPTRSIASSMSPAV